MCFLTCEAKENIVDSEPGLVNVLRYLSGLEIAEPEIQAHIVVPRTAKRLLH